MNSIDMKIPHESVGVWLNEQDPDQRKHLTVECAKQVRSYLLSNPVQELGCLVRRCRNHQFEVIPFTNCDPTAGTIRMGTDEDFETMAKLHKVGTLWGWFHSHPYGLAAPSITDLTRHALDVNMGIYSCFTDRMSVYNTAELDDILQERSVGAVERAG